MSRYIGILHGNVESGVFEYLPVCSDVEFPAIISEPRLIAASIGYQDLSDTCIYVFYTDGEKLFPFIGHIKY